MDSLLRGPLASDFVRWPSHVEGAPQFMRVSGFLSVPEPHSAPRMDHVVSICRCHVCGFSSLAPTSDAAANTAFQSLCGREFPVPPASAEEGSSCSTGLLCV